MNINLTPPLEKFVRSKAASGHDNNGSEVLREAERRLIREDKERKEKLRRLRELGEAGEADIAASRFTSLQT